MKRRILNWVSIVSILTAIVWLFLVSLVHDMDQKEKESQGYKINGRGNTHRFVKRISAVFTDFPSAFCCFLLAGRKIGMIVNFFSNYAGNPVKWLRKI